MSKFLVDTNLLMYYCTSNISDRVLSYLLLHKYVFVTDLCLVELQKIVKLDIHTLASVEIGLNFDINPMFRVIGRNRNINSEVYGIIEAHSMLLGETSKNKRRRDLSFADAELMYYAKELDLIILTNDDYILDCCLKDRIKASNPVLDIRHNIKLLDEYNPDSNNFKYLF